MLTSTVYTVASSDSSGLNTQIFITLPAAYTWVAENAEGLSDEHPRGVAATRGPIRSRCVLGAAGRKYGR
jgi:hypothetical protein